MIKHDIRKFIRDKIKEVGTPANDQVFIGKTTPTWVEDLPAILIHPNNTDVSRFEEAPKTYRKDHLLSIECLASGNNNEDLDFNLEALGQRVQDIIEVDETLGGLVDRIELKNEQYQTEPDGQSPVGSLALTYGVLYYENANKPGFVTYEDLAKVNIDYKIGHHNESSEDDAVNAQSELDIETE